MVRTKTKEKKEYVCQLCGEICGSKAVLTGHTNYYHSESSQINQVDASEAVETSQTQVIETVIPPEPPDPNIALGIPLTINTEESYLDKKGKFSNKKRPLIEPVRCLVFEKGEFGVEELSIQPLPPVSNQRKYNDKWTYIIIRHKESLYAWPADIQEGISPEELFRAVNWPELLLLFKMRQQLLEKIKVGLMVALVGILLLFIFLILSSTEAI